MTESEQPFRPDVWGPDPVPDVVLPPPGQPLDLSQDPDRVQPDGAVAGPAGGPAGGPASGPAGGSVALPPPGQPLDPRLDPDRVQPGDRTLLDLLGEGAQEEARDGYTWLAGLLAVLLFLGVVAYLLRFLAP